MKRMLAMMMVMILTTILSATAHGQQVPSPAEAPVWVPGRMVQGPDGSGPPPPPGNTFVFVASEMGFGGKIVKGSPYTAEAVTESIQTLSDGNRIVNRTTSMLYRDSEGRTRREQTLKSIGAFANGGVPVQTIFINDPVAGVSYALDTRTRVAHRNSPLKLEPRISSGDAPVFSGPVSGQRFEYKIRTNTPPSAGVEVAPPDAPLPVDKFTLHSEPGGVGLMIKTRDGDQNVVRESLGRQIVEGVQADGTRTTLTIPAGEIGNDRAIEVVSERWYSPELQMVVMTKHSDPRAGETTYRLTNISRAEPAKSLFEPPPGFTVSEGFPGMFKKAAPPARMKRPE